MEFITFHMAYDINNISNSQLYILKRRNNQVFFVYFLARFIIDI